MKSKGRRATVKNWLNELREPFPKMEPWMSPSFRLARSSRPTEPIHSMYQPAFCVVAQGRKQALLGEEVFRYDPGHYLIYTVDLPLTFQWKKRQRSDLILAFG